MRLWLTGKLGLGKYTLVDDEDYEVITKMGKWHLREEDFVSTRYNNKLVKLHRFLMDAPKGKQVDHINGNRLDNRKSNLRICDGWQNCANRVKDSRTNKYGFKGIYKRENKTNDNVWRAKIRVKRKYFHLGVFKTKEEAALAYNKAAIEHFGEFARLNDL